MSDLIKLVLLIAFIVFLVAIGPILTIWALNTLFPVLAIPFTIETWASVVLLGAFLKGSVSYKK
jgi:hypothetical protein